jgi:hypothetical protein
MSDRHALPQEDYSPDPFTDGHHLRFQEPQPRPFESTTSLAQDFGGQGGQYDDDELEKEPLTGGNVAGGFYPPGCVEHHVKSNNSPHFIPPGPLTPTSMATRMPVPSRLPLIHPAVSILHGVAGKPSDVA